MINANTASVLSKLVDGVYGRIILKKSPIQYATVSYTVFVVPKNPRTQPIMSTHLIQAQREVAMGDKIMAINCSIYSIN